ncbi:CRISPR-associated endonuclease Cas2 [Kineosporia babensis]|uniref:CRISPR-associated endoribonuclease Cas2 n=1 Tax=Kineosporia babensis TaxID=499548 RepID=A0A9X1SYA5_9ACTN|nr:CRISPR-associated endonuclease Cas2 [Kineosporia babensis]MCD5316901.1 CRISPR-associated endonuclease Cas2 [Kineosporia babensis]
MARRRHLIAYDIRDPTRLRRVAKTMEEYGERLQYSVFVCDLSRTELIHCRAAVEEQMHLTEDSVIIVDIGSLNGQQFTFVGQPLKLPSNGVRIL